MISCSVRNAGGSVVEDDGDTYYSLTSPQLRIPLYHDYRFHSLIKKYFPSVRKSFLKYTGSKIDGSKPELMYAAHTVVQPYYSSIGFLYRGVDFDTSLLNNIKRAMKNSLKSSFIGVDSVETSYGTARRFAYQVLDPVTRIHSYHWEYLVKNNSNLLRFFFWTTNSDTNIISHEIESIVKNIKQ